MNDRRTRAWVEVRGDAVRRNMERVRNALGPDAHVVPMVKADGYGLGAERSVSALEPSEPWGYGVASVEEGRRLRESGIQRQVLVFSPLPPDSYSAAVQWDLTVCLSDLAGLRHLEEAAITAGRTDVPFHIEVDTGMGRAGFDWRDVAVWRPVLEPYRAGNGTVGEPPDRSRAIRWTGCYTHLHSAGVDPRSVQAQWDRFSDVLATLGLPSGGESAARPEEGADILIHVANSAGALCCASILPPVARTGIFLYGGRAGPQLPEPERVVSLRARVVFIRDAPPGTTLGYGATYRAAGPERWATVAIGYGDGLPRALGNRGHALLGGRRVPIVGRVSMDVTVLNISGLEGVDLGDVATFIGRDGEDEITVDEVAEVADTIAYEILTGLTPRLPRVWLEGGGAGAA